jgi:hypothetical protein
MDMGLPSYRRRSLPCLLFLSAGYMKMPCQTASPARGRARVRVCACEWRRVQWVLHVPFHVRDILTHIARQSSR